MKTETLPSNDFIQLELTLSTWTSRILGSTIQIPLGVSTCVRVLLCFAVKVET